MTMDRRTIVTIVLSVLAFSLYNVYLQKKYPSYFTPPPPVEGQPTPEGMEGSATESASIAERGEGLIGDSPNGASSPDQPMQTDDPTSGASESPKPALLSAEELRFENDERIISFNQDRSAITSIQLKKYKSSLKGQEYVELLDSPLVLQATINPSDKLGKRGFEAFREGNRIRFVRQQGDFRIEHVFTLPDEGYEVGIETKFTNVGDGPEELTAGLLEYHNLLIEQSSGGFGPASFVAQQNSFIYSVENSREEEAANSYCEEPEGPVFSLRNETIDFIGFDKHYFLKVLSPVDTKLNYDFERIATNGNTAFCPMSLTAYNQFGFVEAGQSIELGFTAYFGPKDVEILAATNPALQETVKFGFFAVIARPLLAAVKTLYQWVHNYGIAIIIVTLFLKILFFPLTRAAAVSMKRMQKLQPEMTRLREKYKEDPQRQQRELMAFMSKNKVNPAKGCLPILPQIPVFFAFYNVLGQAIELRHAPFFGWIQDLSTADPYYVTPLLLGVAMFIQQKLTPNPSLDKNQEKIMLMMPVIFTVMMLSLPAGMVLYMIVNTLVSIAQQQWLNRRLEHQLG